MTRDDSRERESSLSRRHFAATGVASVAALAAAQAHGEEAQTQRPSNAAGSLITPRTVVLFQGDSITDGGRQRDDATPNAQPALGNGYAWLAAAQLLVDRSDDELVIYNRGISGNKVFQLAERWDADALQLRPHVLSILIGVNDIWHKLNGKHDGTAESYEKEYRALIDRTKAALPQVRLVICEPFVLRCGAVGDAWFPEFDGYRAAARRVADAAGAVFVPFQEIFDRAAKVAPPERWAKDGVHPTPDGAALMAHAWRRYVDGAAR